LTLECGHSRAEILPLKQGRVSIENINTPEGLAAFPVNLKEAAWQ
jgi:hypothetical protein